MKVERFENIEACQLALVCRRTGRRDLTSHRLFAAKVCLTAFVLIFACLPNVAGATISIKTQATVKTEKNRLNVTAKTYNKGNEAAHNVQTNIIFLDEKFESQSRKLLMVNQSEAFHVEKVLSGIKQGRYPLTVMVDFQDGNQYPFSAVVGTTFHYKKDVNPDLKCVAQNLIMEKKDELRIETRNLGVDSKHIRATLVLPKELSAPVTQIDFHIDGRGEKTIFFDIANLSALSGSTYPVWIGLAVFLGMVIVFYQFKKK